MAGRKDSRNKQAAILRDQHPSTPSIMSATLPLPLPTRTLYLRPPPASTQAQAMKHSHPGGDAASSKSRKTSKTQKKVCLVLCRQLSSDY